MYQPHYPNHEHRKERYDLSKLREHSCEDRPNRVTFIVLNEYKLGFEIDWVKETIMFFLYKNKKKEEYMRSERVSWWIGTVPIKMTLAGLIAKYYRSIGKKPEILMYADIELSLYVTHFNYLVWTGQLEKGLAKEVLHGY